MPTLGRIESLLPLLPLLLACFLPTSLPPSQRSLWQVMSIKSGLYPFRPLSTHFHTFVQIKRSLTNYCSLQVAFLLTFNMSWRSSGIFLPSKVLNLEIVVSKVTWIHATIISLSCFFHFSSRLKWLQILPWRLEAWLRGSTKFTQNMREILEVDICPSSLNFWSFPQRLPAFAVILRKNLALTFLHIDSIPSH